VLGLATAGDLVALARVEHQLHLAVLLLQAAVEGLHAGHTHAVVLRAVQHQQRRADVGHVRSGYVPVRES
jgi:hypothetical protein